MLDKIPITSRNTIIRKCLFEGIFKGRNMSKANKGKKDKTALKEQSEAKSSEPKVISLDKSKNIIIQVLAKPGAKQNAISDISSDGVGIQINAPPTEGEANTELVKYLSSVLGIRKGDVSLEKGFKSRNKTVKILSSSITLEQVEEKIKNEMS